MTGYCTLVLYFHSPVARETATHSCNIQPYYLLTHQIVYIYFQMLWSKEFKDAVFSDRNLEGKTPLQLAVENGHIK